ncbi:unnamed protein product [[Actinomadura] parvosata subsp. kistnae]|uniref:DUF2127 domain-containing protein n=1 Tax=[Actinomadura] parvosata subsp. kistnae TaxID=1909395 RepID=A0A1U9ZX80_9ACTN|nr:hypothetical protein [Nonomuraea sp. ATCC 55076]AQZ62550.1 hypothetical protein BKM31_14745 [Nonomuraea sp. ATCC 55076]SPL88817.1 unnamed protein product [Actinomadura parvosata subsp. kistnae]
MTTTPMSGSVAGRPSAVADRIGRTLMAVDAVATLVALVNGILIMNSVADDRVITEAWRTLAYVVFAGIWAILAVAPRRQWGLWELLLFHKGAITIYCFVMWDKPDAVQTAFIDLSLVVTTAVAYVLCRGWTSWRTGASEPVGRRSATSAG